MDKADCHNRVLIIFAVLLPKAYLDKCKSAVDLPSIQKI